MTRSNFMTALAIAGALSALILVATVAIDTIQWETPTESGPTVSENKDSKAPPRKDPPPQIPPAKTPSEKSAPPQDSLGFAIEGTVIHHESGAPVSQVALGAILQNDPDTDNIPTQPAGMPGFMEAPPSLEEGEILAYSSRDGKFRIPNLFEGTFEIRVLDRFHYLVGSERPSANLKPGKEIATVSLEVARGGSIQGTVRDPLGRPVANAFVSCTTGFESMVVVPSNSPKRARRLPATLSDQAGSFEIRGIPEGQAYRLKATCDGYAPAREERLRVRAGETSPTIELVLRPAATIIGQIVEEDGAPVPEASLVLYSRSFGELIRTGFDRAKGLSEPDGFFEVTGLEAGKKSLFVHTQNHATHEKTGLELKEGATVDLGPITLLPGMTLRGKVIGGDDQPLANVKITARSTRREMPQEAGQREATTRETGEYQVVGLAKGTYRVTAEMEGLSAQTKRSVEAGQTDIDFRLEAFGSISGTVLEVTTMAPVPSFRVRISPKSTGSRAPGPPGPGDRFRRGSGKSEEFEDEEGRFTLDAITPGFYTVRASGPGFVAGEDSIEVEVKSGEEVTDVTVLVTKAGVIFGRVVRAEDGAPVPSVRVKIGEPQAGFGRIMASRSGGSQSGKDGTFRLEDLTPGTVSLTAYPAEYPEATRSDIEVLSGQETGPIDIMLEPGGGIYGSVYDETGNPDTSALIGVGKSVMNMLRTAATDHSGYYEIKGLAQGVYLATKTNLGENFLAGMVNQTANVKSGEMVRIDFGKGSPGCTVEGQLIDSEGGVPQAALTATLNNPEYNENEGQASYRSTTTNNDGFYKLAGLATGTYSIQIRVRKTPSSPTRNYLFQAKIPDTESHLLNITLPEGGFSGVVMDEDTGSPLPGVTVKVALTESDQGSGFSRFSSRDLGQEKTDEGGRYTFSYLFPGTYMAEAQGRAGYGRRVIDRITVKEDQITPNIDFGLLTSGSIEGTIVDPDGKPVSRAYVHLRDSNGVEITSFTGLSDNEGKFVVRDLSPEEYRVTVLSGQFAASTRKVQVESSVTAEEDFRLSIGGDLKLTAVSSTGAPLTSTKVDILNAEGESLLVDRRLLLLFSGGSDRTGPDGTLEVQHIPAGRYTIVIDHPRGSAREQVVIQNGQLTEKRVRAR